MRPAQSERAVHEAKPDRAIREAETNGAIREVETFCEIQTPVPRRTTPTVRARM
jgi:hypothetical protein